MRVLCAVFLLLTTLFACQDKDEIPPNIIFLTPTENTQFKYDEQIVVEANVSDNDIVERVTFRIIGEESITSVGESVSVFPNQKDANVRGVLQIRDSLLDGGRYFIEVEAFDGENEFSSFLAIRIEALAKKKISTIVTLSNGSTTEIYEDENDLNFQLKNIYPFGFKGSTLNNDDQHYWFLPNNHNEIFAYSVKTNQQVYTEQYNSSFSNPFVGIERVGRIVYVGVKGEIDGSSEQFTDRFTALLSPDRKLTSLSVSEDYLLASETDLQGNGGELKVFGVTSSSGFARNTIQMSHDVKKAFIYERDKGVVFYNTTVNGTPVGAVGNFEVDENGLRETEVIPEPIRDVIRISDNEYLIATNTLLLRYMVSSERAFVFTSVNSSAMYYDEFQSQLYIGANQQLRVYNNYPQTSSRVLNTFNSSIRSIATRYNKN